MCGYLSWHIQYSQTWCSHKQHTYVSILNIYIYINNIYMFREIWALFLLAYQCHSGKLGRNIFKTICLMRYHLMAFFMCCAALEASHIKYNILFVPFILSCFCSFGLPSISAIFLWTFSIFHIHIFNVATKLNISY